MPAQAYHFSSLALLESNIAGLPHFPESSSISRSSLSKFTNAVKHDDLDAIEMPRCGQSLLHGSSGCISDMMDYKINAGIKFAAPCRLVISQARTC
jgi:hypothetical protein